VIPLMRYLQMQMQSRWARHVMTGCMLLMAASALGSHSRGALLAIGAMAVVLWWRGKNKFGGAFVMVAGGALMLSMMPAEWWERMNTIKTYNDDDSALGRINAWWMAYNLAKDRFFGGGFQVSLPELFALYAPEPLRLHAAHSIYFMVLGEHGFIGLFLFLTLFTLAYFSAGRLRKQGQRQPQTQWLSDLGSMCQVALVGYAVGGAFLSLSYWDLPYNIIIVIVVGCRWLDRKTWLREPEEPLIYLPEAIKKRLAKRKAKIPT
jgi:putative inorganic carbon (hco3(-)) transporter